MEAFTAIYFGTLIGAVAPDIEVASAMVAPFAVTFFLFAG